MCYTLGNVGGSKKRLLDELESGSGSLRANNVEASPYRRPLCLRMKKVDIETIYPQHEKDREGEKLKRLCAQQETQKSVHADGNMLIKNFVKTRHEGHIDLDVMNTTLG